MPMEPTRLVAKLLALAIDQAGKPEGILARRKAEELIARYDIAKEDICSAEAQLLVKEKTITLPESGWAFDLLASVAHLCSSIVVRIDAGQAIVFGRLFHVEVTALFYEQILRQLDEGFRGVGGAGLWGVEEIDDWRASFCLGVAKKLDELVEKANFGMKGREICIRAAHVVFRERFARFRKIENYSKARKPVPAAFFAGADVELREGIRGSFIPLIGRNEQEE